MPSVWPQPNPRVREGVFPSEQPRGRGHRTDPGSSQRWPLGGGGGWGVSGISQQANLGNTGRGRSISSSPLPYLYQKSTRCSLRSLTTCKLITMFQLLLKQIFVFLGNKSLQAHLRQVESQGSGVNTQDPRKGEPFNNSKDFTMSPRRFTLQFYHSPRPHVDAYTPRDTNRAIQHSVLTVSVLNTSALP